MPEPGVGQGDRRNLIDVLTPGWLREMAGEQAGLAASGAAEVKDVAAYLAGLDRTRLVDMVLTVALHADRLLRRLRLEAARAVSAPEGLVATLRQTIDELLGPHVRRGDATANDLALPLDELIHELERLCDAGHAAEVVELAERALNAGEAAIEFVDDSDGVLGGQLDRLQEVHHRACLAARPDPVDLARRLFSRAMTGAGYTSFGRPAAYADVLGDAGLAEYRRLASTEWERAPALGPRQQDARSDRHRIASIMEELAELSGDVEAIVAVKQRDLSTPGRYLEVAETAGRRGTCSARGAVFLGRQGGELLRQTSALARPARSKARCGLEPHPGTRGA